MDELLERISEAGGVAPTALVQTPLPEAKHSGTIDAVVERRDSNHIACR